MSGNTILSLTDTVRVKTLDLVETKYSNKYGTRSPFDVNKQRYPVTLDGFDSVVYCRPQELLEVCEKFSTLDMAGSMSEPSDSIPDSSASGLFASDFDFSSIQLNINCKRKCLCRGTIEINDQASWINHKNSKEHQEWISR